jgi:hypothetical protein
VPGPAPGLEHVAAGETEPFQAIPDRGDQGTVGVVRVDRGSPRGGVLLVGQQVLQLGALLGEVVLVEQLPGGTPP